MIRLLKPLIYMTFGACYVCLGWFAGDVLADSLYSYMPTPVQLLVCSSVTAVMGFIAFVLIWAFFDFADRKRVAP
jgi:hypothetical protein